MNCNINNAEEYEEYITNEIKSSILCYLNDIQWNNTKIENQIENQIEIKPFIVVLFYKYAYNTISFLHTFIAKLHVLCQHLGILGRILLAVEGCNGTIAGSKEAIEIFVKFYEEYGNYDIIDWKYSIEQSSQLPFNRLSIRYVKEILSPGDSGTNIINGQIEYDKTSYGGLKGTGIHISPQEFHNRIKSNEKNEYPMILDIRNKYEYNVGHFENSVCIDTHTYSETWKSLDKLMQEKCVSTNEPLYLACTGGIRCEKASAYLRAKGYDNVFQLQGGIHRYLETFPDGGLFHGKNFVFDNRINQSINNLQTKDILGKCQNCQIPCDIFNNTCTVCRIQVLICVNCNERNLIKEFYCERHFHLKSIYYTNLTSFSIDELIQQKEALENIANRYITRKDRNRKATIQKQIVKINLRISELTIK